VSLHLCNYFDNIENIDKSTAINVLSALAQDTRLEIFRHLTQTGPQPAGQIGEPFGLPLATLSFQLREMQNARSTHRSRRASACHALLAERFAIDHATLQPAPCVGGNRSPSA